MRFPTNVNEMFRVKRDNQSEVSSKILDLEKQNANPFSDAILWLPKSIRQYLKVGKKLRIFSLVFA